MGSHAAIGRLKPVETALGPTKHAYDAKQTTQRLPQISLSTLVMERDLLLVSITFTLGPKRFSTTATTA
ncbi:MAG: hypothetical protein AAFX98_09490 [Pseudomonadota bacterium]